MSELFNFERLRLEKSARILSIYKETDELIQKSESMKVDKKDMVDEHKKLIKVLESPSHEDDKKEAEKQKKELEEYEGLKKAYETLGLNITDKQ